VESFLQVIDTGTYKRRKKKKKKEKEKSVFFLILQKAMTTVSNRPGGQLKGMGPLVCNPPLEVQCISFGALWVLA
jgi:hypothetical protein